MMEDVDILIVDENPTDRRKLIDEVASFNHYRYQISETDTFEKAFDLVSNNKIGLMFLNLSIKDSEGMVTFRKLEKEFPKIAKIVLTDKSDERYRNELLEEGAQDFLVKDKYNRDELFKTINYAIERNKTRSALIETKILFQSTIDSLSDSIAILDEKGIIIYVNKAWREFAEENNYQTGNAGLGLNYIEIALGSDDKDKIGEDVARAIIDIIEGSKVNYSIEYPCHLHDRDRWFILKLTSFVQNNKKRIVAKHEDITSKKEIENLNSKRFHVIEQSPVSIFLTDVDGKIEYVNPKFEEVSGFRSNEVIGKRPRILEPGVLPREQYQKLLARIRSGKEWVGEFNNEKKNGTIYCEYIKISPIINEHGEITNFVGVKEDITHRKKTEAELIKSKKEAEKSDKLKSEFLTQISHEIRTPVNTLLSFSSLIEKELEGAITEDLAESFEYMGKAGNRIIRTIDLIIKMSELHTENYETDFMENDLIELLNNLVEQYKPLADKKNLSFNFIKMIDSAKILFDKQTVHDVFCNLIDNAVKYTSSGGIKIIVKRNAMNKLNVEVTDTGIGISQKYFIDIFKPFSQETSGYTRIFDGNGLGLTLVKKYCELNNADVLINSSKTHGSTFSVVFNKS